MKGSDDGLWEQTYTMYSDGSTGVENYFYHDEDSYDYDYEVILIEADGSESYEYTDAFGNTNTESWDASGNEYYGMYCDPEEPVDGEDQWCWESGRDEEGNYWETETGPDGWMCERIYFVDGSMQDCDGNTLSEDGLMIIDQYEDDAGNVIYVKEDEEGNVVTETYDPTTGESTEVKANADGLTMVYEEWDSAGNYVVYLEDANSGDRIVEVYDYMGSMTTTIYFADGTSETTKIDEAGNEIAEGYYDEEDNYVTLYFDNELNVDVTRKTDPWGYYSIEYMMGEELVTYYYDPTGWEIVKL